MNKAERLAVAGVLAPQIRGQADRLARRPVKIWNQQTGETVGVMSALDVQKGINATANIEFDVMPDTRPQATPCGRCGAPVPQADRAPLRKHCDRCTGVRCKTCGKVKSNKVRGYPQNCAECKRAADRKTHCARGHEFTPENIQKNSRGGRACRTCANLSSQRARERRSEKESGDT